MNTLKFLKSDKLCYTFTDVVVDLVSWRTGDHSLTAVTPCSIHTAFTHLAGTCRQTLIYVWMLGKRNKCISEKKENK